MKIRNKVFIALVFIILIFTLLPNQIIINFLQKQLIEEQLKLTKNTTKQILLSYNYQADIITTSCLNSCHQRKLTSDLANPSTEIARVNLGIKLDYIVSNSALLTDAFIIDQNKNLYYSSNTSNKEYYQSQFCEEFFTAGEKTYWFIDTENRLYLCLDLNQIFPYERRGNVVFEINRQYLRHLCGTNSLNEGQMCIFDKFGQILLLSTDDSDNLPYFETLIKEIREGKKIPQMVTFKNSQYYVVVTSGTKDGIFSIYIVGEEAMIASYVKIRKFINILVGVMVATSFLAAYLFSVTFTKKIHMLQNYIHDFEQSDKQNMQYRIPDMGHDEIGLLARNFNHMLLQISELHQIIIRENEAKQKAKYDLLEFQYRSLLSQISPHFLCNIMQSISLLAMEKKTGQVEKLAISAGSYLRNNLRENDKRYNTVLKEIQYAEGYINLANMISAVPICLKTVCDSKIENAIVPNMILQPLVENSVKHGIPSKMEGMFEIDLIINVSGSSKLRLTIHDNGVGYCQSVLKDIGRLGQEPKDHFESKEIGFGTAGVIRRLELQYGNNYMFHIENASDGGALTIIELPLKMEYDENSIIF